MCCVWVFPGVVSLGFLSGLGGLLDDFSFVFSWAFRLVQNVPHFGGSGGFSVMHLGGGRMWCGCVCRVRV